MKNRGLAIPHIIWMTLFVVLPVLLVVVYAFTTKDGAFTLDNFSNMNQYVSAFGRSFLLAILATAISFLLGYPVAYFLSREGVLLRKVAMMLIMLP